MISTLKKLSRHIIIYSSGIIVGKLISFFLIPLYTHYLTPHDYGILELLELSSYIIGYFLVMGLPESILRYYPAYDEEKEKNSLISTAVIFTLILGIVGTFIIFQTSRPLAEIILTSSQYAYLFCILAVNMFLVSLMTVLKTTFRAQQRSIFYTKISIVYTAIAVILNIFFVAWLKLGMRGILYSTLITSSLICSYLMVVIFWPTGFSFSISKLFQMLKYGVPFFPHGILMFIFHWSDRYILRIYCDMTTIGLYALGYKIGMVLVFLIAVPFNLIYRAYVFDIEQKPDAKSVYSRVATYYLSLLVVVGLLIATLAREIITVLADPSYLNAYKVIPLIVLSMIFMSSDYVFQVGILLKKKTGYLPAIAGVAAGTNILLNFSLIPRYNMMGAALATAISFFIYVLGIYVVAQKLYFIPFEFSRIGKIFLSSIAIFFLTNLFTFQDMFFSTGIKVLFTSLTLALILYLAKFLLPEEKIQLIHSVKSLLRYVLRPWVK